MRAVCNAQVPFIRTKVDSHSYAWYSIFRSIETTSCQRVKESELKTHTYNDNDNYNYDDASFRMRKLHGMPDRRDEVTRRLAECSAFTVRCWPCAVVCIGNVRPGGYRSHWGRNPSCKKITHWQTLNGILLRVVTTHFQCKHENGIFSVSFRIRVATVLVQANLLPIPVRWVMRDISSCWKLYLLHFSSFLYLPRSLKM